MRVANEILAARVYGKVRCGFSRQASCTVAELAREFGLRDDASCYTEVNEPAAREVIRSVLHKDLAYRSEIMPETRAKELADLFLAQFAPDTRFFTNGTWHEPTEFLADGVSCGPSWMPATDATFDAGVLAVGRERSGCLWIEPLKAATWLKLLQLVEHLQSSDPEQELTGIIILDHLVLHKPDLPDPVREWQIKRFVNEWRAQNAERPTWGDQLRREMQKRFPAKPKINVSVWVDWRDYSPLQDGLPEMHYRFKIERPGKTLTEDSRAKGIAEAKRIICEAFEF